MKRFLCIGLASIFILSSCRHKKEVVQITTISVPASDSVSSKTTASPAKEEIYRFVVSFYSIGSGPDVKAHMSYSEYIDNYQAQKKKTLSIEETPWGREGEVDYCMKLTELNDAEQREFIANLKSLLADAKWVHYYENQPCRYKNADGQK